MVAEVRNRIRHEPLERTAIDLLLASGMALEHARATAAGLIRADLRGVETHGVSNMLRNYMDWLKKGECSAHPDVKTIWSRGGLTGIDSDRAIGLAILPELIAELTEKAKIHGIAATVIGNGRHAGMMAHHALLIAERGMIGLAFTATSSRVVPTWGREARLGTNPISIAAPCGDGRYVCFDAATSAVPGNRVTNALRTGGDITRAAVVEPDGVVNATAIKATNNHLRRLAPMGGLEDEASHKGYGLAVMVELLCGTMIDDGGLSARVPGGATHFVCAICPSSAPGDTGFEKSVKALAAYLNDTPPAVGHHHVLYPGEKEEATAKRRLEDGIPLHSEVIDWLRGACAAAGVEMPEVL